MSLQLSVSSSEPRLIEGRYQTSLQPVRTGGTPALRLTPTQILRMRVSKSSRHFWHHQALVGLWAG
jgi:hypothetical protein